MKKKCQKTFSASPASSPAKSAETRFIESFQKNWRALFESPVHLDSLLSKLLPEEKAAHAEIMPLILRRPVSLARELGLSVADGEPWSLTAAARANWSIAESIARELFTIREQDPEGFPERFAGMGSAADFPPEMLEEWGQASSKLARALTGPAPLTVRVSRSIAATQAAQALPEFKPCMSSPLGWTSNRYVAILKRELFEKGQAEIQDEGSQLIAIGCLEPETLAPLLDETPGFTQRPERPLALAKPKAATWIDACAGAGGKTLALADLLQNRGRVYAYDVSDIKLQALRRRARKVPYTNLQTLTLDREKFAEQIVPFHGKADGVLVDAPCSGWGVLKRNPDIKWRQRPDELLRLPLLQLDFLKTFGTLVKPGGLLVYSACTFRKAETMGTVEALLAATPEFEKISAGYLGPAESDGFFVAIFRRTASSKI